MLASARRAAATALLMAAPALADVPVLRIATQVAGTVNREVATITARGFDCANGFALQVQDVASGPAAQVALQGGTADVIVSDLAVGGAGGGRAGA